jgi:hypothetical protein
VVGVKSHEKPSLDKQCPYFYENLSTMVVGNHLHEKSPSAQKGTHQKSQKVRFGYLGILQWYQRFIPASL